MQNIYPRGRGKRERLEKDEVEEDGLVKEKAPGRQGKGRRRSGGWLEATDRPRGVHEGDARGKVPQQGGTA